MTLSQYIIKLQELEKQGYQHLRVTTWSEWENPSVVDAPDPEVVNLLIRTENRCVEDYWSEPSPSAMPSRRYMKGEQVIRV